jgi:DNA-binding IclR family transcriptional regulator
LNPPSATDRHAADRHGPSRPAVAGTQSVFRALSILQAVTPDAPWVTAASVASRFGYSLPTAHRLLRALESERFLTFGRTVHEYQPGPEILRLSGIIIDHDDLIPRALDSLARLRALTGESVALQWRLGNSRSSMNELVSPHAVHVATGVGRCYPLTRGAAGKALLAASAPEDVESVLADPAAAAPAAGRDRFRAELESARTIGYARSHGETIAGAASVAGVVDWIYRGVAAISITGPEARFGPSQQLAAGHALLRELDRLRAAQEPHAHDRPGHQVTGSSSTP